MLSQEEAIALSATGPILRSTGVEWDLRLDMPYLAYDQVDFDVIVGTYGDSFDRYAIRLNEITRVDPDRSPDRQPDAEGRLSGARPQGDPASNRIDESMKRSSITSSYLPKVSRCRRARRTPRSKHHAVNSVATS
ncbi:MAG: hypothetical protein R2706_16135 [Acidimicrobiales bacterium]